MKRLCILTIIISLLSICSITYAAPEEFASELESTADDLIALSDSEAGKESVTTFETPYILSGSGQEGVIVTLYVYNGGAEKYQKIKIKKEVKKVETIENGENNTYTEEKVEVVEKDLNFEIGASGLFMQEINLNDGENKIALYAEKEVDNFQIVELNINKLNGNFKTFLEKLTVDIKSELMKLMGNDKDTE